MTEESVKGSCLCGAIRYEVPGPARYLGNCHCSMCRKQHGAAFSTYAQFSRDGFHITQGEDGLKSYASSPPVKRQFCETCGSTLFFLYANEPNQIWIAAGTLDTDPGVPHGGHIFVGSKAPWYPITDDLPQHEAYG